MKQYNAATGKIEDIVTLAYSDDEGAFWEPPAQPDMNFGAGHVPSSRDAEGLINTLYEPLRKVDPVYITRKILGRDQSNTFNVYQYTFSPKSYTKTIILSAGTHGNEDTAFLSLYRFLFHLVHDYRNYPQLAYIRENVKLVIVPFNNPWGVTNNVRQNSRAVDLNRNTDYLWDKITGTKYQTGGVYYKGTAPFSEAETQIVRGYLEGNSEAIAYIDFHNIQAVKAEYIVYTPRYLTQHREIFGDVIHKLRKPTDRVVYGSAAVPTLYCYAANRFAMTTGNPEWWNGRYSDALGPSNMTEILRFFGNIIIKACGLEYKTNVLETGEKFSKLFMYNKTGTEVITNTGTSYSNIKHTIFDFNIKRFGLLKMRGHIKITLTEAATVGINPFLYQVYHPDFAYSTAKDTLYGEYIQALAPGTYTIPINNAMHVFPTNYSEAGGTQRAELAKMRIQAKVSVGTITIENFRIWIDYEPNNLGNPFEVYDATGKEAAAEGSDFVLKYPIITANDDGDL